MEVVLPAVLLFTLAAAATPSPDSGPVPVPFTFEKSSYNFNTTLYWNYYGTFVSPYFQVEYKTHKIDWTVVETCEKISRNYCDLSEKIVEPYDYYTVRVKAFVGSAQTSDYADTEIYLISDGIIGPPSLNASHSGRFITVDVWYPPVGGEKNVGDYFDDLTYNVYYGNETEETDECDRFGCSIKIAITNQTKYCFSAQGRSDTCPMTMEKSKELCITTNETKENSNSILAAVICVSLVVITLLSVCLFIIIRRIKGRSNYPLTLNNIAKAMTTHINLPSGQMTTYDQVSISPVDSPEEKTTPEEAEKDRIVSDEPDLGESIDNGYHSSVGETEQKVDEDQSGNEEPSSTRNYYRTENSDSSIVCITEDDIKPVTNSFGYDKPHCPL